MAEEKLWERILQENLQTSGIEESHLILLGAKQSGKRALLNALQKGPGNCSAQITELIGATEISPGPLKYGYVSVKNPDDAFSERLTKLNAWLLTSTELPELLNFALKPEYLKNTVLGVCLDSERPEGFLEELSEWLGIWHDKLGSIISQLPLADQDEIVGKITKYHQTFNTDVEVPIEEGTLEVNMGVPIVVFVNKSDLIMTHDKSRDKSGMIIDFLQ